jgi:nudix-type nucleoside diphosphatase (YffH/AdpP family)
MIPTILKQTVIHDGWGRYLLMDVGLPDGAVVQRQLDDHGSAAAVLPYDASRRVALLVRLPRMGPLFKGLDPYLIEAPAGMIDTGESADACVRREAMEETGVKLTALEPVVRAWPTPGVSSETMDLYLARFSLEDRIGQGGGVAGEHEDIQVIEMPLADLWLRARGGAITDLKTLLLIYALHERRPDLFS